MTWTRRARSRIFVWTVVVSALAHLAPLWGPGLMTLVRSWLAPGPTVALASSAPTPTTTDEFRSHDEIQAARRKLVRTALEDRRQGQLRLDAFLMQADALDAEERKQKLDGEEVARLYRARCMRLTRAFDDHGPWRAVDHAFDDIAYSAAVSSLSELLVTKVGSCGPTAQLIAACLYDAKQRKGLALHYWGGVGASGATHVTATWNEREVSIDLATGKPRQAGGIAISPSELVEAYARAHDLLPPLPGLAAAERGTSPRIDAAAVARFAYPPNADVFEGGEAPIFAKRQTVASAANGSPGAGSGSAPARLLLGDELFRDLSFEVLPGAGTFPTKELPCLLEPPALYGRQVAITTTAGASLVELVPVVSDQGLTTIGAALARYEREAPRKTRVQRLTRHTCLALAYEWAAVRFVAAAQVRVASEAARRGKRHQTQAEQLHAALKRELGAGFLEQLGTNRDHWTLVAISHGATSLIELEQRAAKLRRKGDDTRLEPWVYMHQEHRLKALLAKPEHRQRVFEVSPGFSLSQKLALIGVLMSLKLTAPELELPESGWIPRALTAYEAMLTAMPRHAGVGTHERYYEQHIALLRALDASASEVGKQRRVYQRLLDEEHRNNPYKLRGPR